MHIFGEISKQRSKSNLCGIFRCEMMGLSVSASSRSRAHHSSGISSKGNKQYILRTAPRLQLHPPLSPQQARTTAYRLSPAMKPLLFAFVLLQCSLLLHFGQASRFRVNGPVLTVTLKDPMVDGSSSSSPRSKWLNLDNIRPNLHWSFQSTSKPLPKWFPSLQSLQGTVGYHYDQMKRAPTFVEGGAKFRIKGDIELDVLPTYEVKSERTTLMLQISKGAAIYGMAKFRNMALEMIRGCYQVDLPYASVGAIRVTPTWNVLRGEPSCVLEGTTGSQRTKAVINLEYQNPTLTVVHALDDRHVIAPEISLYNARIVYQWNVALNSGSIRTKVDPTDSVHVTWTDHSTSGGKWVTDMRLPLVGTSISALAADIRVRRQFSF